MEQSTGEVWAAATVARILTNITTERKMQHLSAQDLSDKCEALGYPIARRVLSKMDNHARSNISIPELIVIANALRVAPLDLIYSPYEIGVEVEVLPGDFDLGIEAESRFTHTKWGKAGAPETSKVRGHIEIVMELERDALGQLVSLHQGSASGFSADLITSMQQRLTSTVEALLRSRDSLGKQGVELHELPEPLQPLADVIQSSSEDEK